MAFLSKMAPEKLSRTQISQKRIVKSTRKSYDSGIKKFKGWLSDNHSDALDENGSIRVPLPNEDVIIDFLTDSQLTGSNADERKTAFSTMNGLRSAIRDMYRERGKMLSERTNSDLSNFMSGYKRDVQEAKQKGELSIFEGKRHISYSGYKTLALEVLKVSNETEGGLYGHCFIVLSWNLFARSNSVANLMLHHFDWKEDAMIITLPKHKGDQEGLHVYPKHVYANPVYPELCPILSLGIYLLSANNFRRDGAEWTLFHGTMIETKFSHWLKRLLDKNIPSLSELNNMKKDIGTHSFRKGVVSYVLSFPSGPTVVAAFLRASWSLGAVQQRYIFEGEGSDQFLGRVASGLPVGEQNFQALPPRFDPSFVLTNQELEILYPNVRKPTMPKGFLACLPYFLASIVYHSSWLESNLCKSHPLFKSPIWTSNFINYAKPYVVAGIKRCDRCNIVATGVPPSIDMKHDIAHLQECLKYVYDAVCQNTDKLSERISSSIKDLPATLGDYIVANFQVNGAVPITVDQFNRLREEIRQDVVQEIRRTVTDQSKADDDPRCPQLEAEKFKAFSWKGRFHPVPEDFQFSVLNLSNLWNLWHNGDPSQSIGPYKNITPGVDLQTVPQRYLFSKAKSCMKAIEDAAKEICGDRELSNTEVFELGLNQLITKVESAKRQANKPVYENRRYGEISFGTLYNDLKYIR